MRTRTLIVLGLVLMFVLSSTASAMALDELATSAGCGLASCHSHPGFADFNTWHDSHRAAPLNIPCQDCHPNGHTVPSPSAPETTYSVAVACSGCHVATTTTVPAHTAAGITSCVGCHPNAGTLSGTVVGSGGPLGGVVVTVTGSPSVLTYQDGSYFVPRVPVGTYSATYAKTGYIDRTITGIVFTNGGATTQSVTLVADSTPPVTTSDARASYADSATIDLSATDTGSGVAHTYYTLDGHPKLEGTTVTVSTLGTHTLEFWSLDYAHNEETPHRSASFGIGLATVLRLTSTTIRSSAATILYGKTVTLSGVVAPNASGQLVTIQRRINTGSWAKLTTASINSSSAYTRTISRMTRGAWQFRAYYAGTSSVAASYSPPLRVVVK